MNSKIMSAIKFVKKTFTECKAPLFRIFMVLVLIQFAVLSFAAHATVAVNVTKIFRDSNYLWGVASLFGAACLTFEYYIKDWLLGRVVGYLASVTAFLYLGYDYLLYKPPLYAGSIVMVTAAVILGGLFYGGTGKGS